MTEDLWEKWPRLFPPWSEEDPTTFDSLRRVLLNWKVENTPIINEAMEKAERYEDWQIEWNRLHGIIAEKNKKLEAFKNHLNAVPKSQVNYFPWSISPISFNNLMENLYKILEGEE